MLEQRKISTTFIYGFNISGKRLKSFFIEYIQKKKHLSNQHLQIITIAKTYKPLLLFQSKQSGCNNIIIYFHLSLPTLG